MLSRPAAGAAAGSLRRMELTTELSQLGFKVSAPRSTPESKDKTGGGPAAPGRRIYAQWRFISTPPMRPTALGPYLPSPGWQQAKRERGE
jgi:hypothetical protein